MTFEYHRLARSWPKWSWWRPLALAGIAGAFFLTATVAISVAVMVPIILDPWASTPLDDLLFAGIIDYQNPWILAFTLVSVIIMLPALILAALLIGPRPLGLLSSVAGRLRWGWMMRLVLPAVVVFAVFLGVVVALSIPPDFTVLFDTNTVILLVIILLLVPLQATAEEYVFRGYLMQTIGTWLKHPAWAILLPVPLFVLGHLYDVWGLTDVAVMAIFAGWLTWRTGGLEAAIVLHVVNNVFVFALGAFGLVDTNSMEGDPLGVLVTVATLAAFTVWTLWLHGRHGVERTRTVEPQPMLVPDAWPPAGPTASVVDDRPEQSPPFVG